MAVQASVIALDLEVLEELEVLKQDPVTLNMEVLDGAEPVTQTVDLDLLVINNVDPSP